MRIHHTGKGGRALACTALWLTLMGCAGDDIGDEAEDPCGRPTPTFHCEPMDLNFGSPEGGEVRFEYMEWPAVGCGDNGDQPCGPEGATTAARVTAYQLLAMTPDRMPLPIVGGCSSMINLDTWPTGQGTGRRYAEMGELTISGGAFPLEVPAADPETLDPLGRSHDSYNYYFGADASARFVTPNSFYDVSWTGDGANSPARDLPASIYMPGPFTLFEPAFAANTEIPNTGDLVFTWGDEGNAEVPERDYGGMASLVAFFVPGFGMTHLCIGLDTGEIVVPSLLVNEAAALTGEDNKATLVRAKLTTAHQGGQTSAGENYRRIDMIGSYSYLNEITFVDPG